MPLEWTGDPSQAYWDCEVCRLCVEAEVQDYAPMEPHQELILQEGYGSHHQLVIVIARVPEPNLGVRRGRRKGGGREVRKHSNSQWQHHLCYITVTKIPMRE